jgi:hypothetical protein
MTKLHNRPEYRKWRYPFSTALAVIARRSRSNPEYLLILCSIFLDCFGLRLAMTATSNKPGCHHLLFVATNITPRNDGYAERTGLSFPIVVACNIPPRNDGYAEQKERSRHLLP